MGKKQGGWYDVAKEMAVVNGKWKAIPFCNIGQLMNWRTDWFAEVGVKKFPETWEELYEVGKKLKAKDHPFGFELGHGFGDNHGWLYPLLWSYGGHEVAEDGKTVMIDSDETARAVDFARKFFKDTMFDDVLGWTDVSNNKAWFAEQISCTNNAESILWFAKRDFPEIAKVTEQSQNPAGPKGRFHLLGAISHSIFNFTPQEKEAHDFLRWLIERSSWAPGMPRPTAIISRCCTATTTRRCGMSSRATSPTATRSAPVICRAGRRRRPPAGRKCRQIRRRRHVRQGLRRRLDQGGHQERRGAAEGDLQDGLISASGATCRSAANRWSGWRGRRARPCRCPAGSTAKRCSAG